jgi:hypothetical protein
MSFDMESAINDMLAAASGVISGEWPGVKDCVKKAFDDEKEALEDIARARVAEDINDDDVESQLEDEKVALEAALLACQVKTKVMAQNATNAAINSLKTAIQAAL